MITSRELISVCRQIGGMMEAGVDILRITRVLRSQTSNARLLDLYDQIDHELTMGRGLADVLARASDVFSPFAISLVRQGEERNNLAGAFLRIADFLEKEVDLQNGAPVSTTLSTQQNLNVAAPLLPPSMSAAPGHYRHDDSSRTEALWTRSVGVISAWMFVVAAVFSLGEIGIFPMRWRTVAALFLCALVGVVAVWKSSRVGTSSSRKQDTPFDFSEQTTGELFAPSPQPDSLQSTLNNAQDESGSSAVSWDDSEDMNQSTLIRAAAQDAMQHEESENDGTETDASALLGRLKKRGTPRDEAEEEFD